MSIILPDGGEAGAALRRFDWASSPLGPIDTWPMSLVSLVRTLLVAKQPMIVWWGPELIQFYNDAMLDSMRDKHPIGMGQPGREAWKQAWIAVGDQLQAVVDDGTAIWQEDIFVPVDRNGRLEDAWWTYNYSPVFDDAGHRNGIVITCTETTAGVVARAGLSRARMEAERARAELHEAFMQSPIPVAIMTGPDYTFTLANKLYVELVQRPVVGSKLFEVFTEEEVGYYRPLLDRAYLEGESVVVLEFPLRLEDGEGGAREMFLDIHYQPYRDVDGRVVGVMAQITDVTSRVRERERAVREQELRAAAEEHARSRDNFLAMLSHELRNPLAAIASAVELMRVRTDASRERDVIDRQVHHLTHLVDDLLDTARIVRGKLELRRVPVDVHTFVSVAIEQAMAEITSRRHQFRYVPPAFPVAVDGDHVRLAQTVANLLTNAARYTPSGGAIELTAAREDEDAVITVTDTGPGFAPDLLPHVFDPFVQGPRRAGREEGGLGLGLALVKQLVVMHGGAVTVANRPEGGSRVVIRIPALERAAEPLAPPSHAPATPPAHLHRILVVDDNEDAGELLGELLRVQGHEVITVATADAALATLEAFRADIGVFDIGLPDIDGYELCRRVRALPGGRDMRLAAVTGYGADGDRAQTAAAGFDIHLTKPITLAALVAFVNG